MTETNAILRPARRLSSRSRPIAKALTWQAIGLVCSTLIGFALTGSFATGGQFALASASLGTLLFVAHEWVWERLG